MSKKMTFHLLLCSSLFQLVSLAALRAEGAFGGGKFVLLTAQTNAAPELDSFAATAAAQKLCVSHFDDHIHLNDWVFPQHPREWVVQDADAPLYERLFRSAWNLGDADLHLCVESLPNAPGGALAQVFSSARVSMHSDGLMSYGPLRRALPALIADRVSSMYSIDLVPGLSPVRLRDYGVQNTVVSASSLRPIFAELNTAQELRSVLPTLHLDGPAALLLGQYLSASRLLTAEQENRLHCDMIDRALGAGLKTLIFKPHPAAPPATVSALADYAREQGARLTVLDTPVSAETVFEHLPLARVYSCFSTALATAKYSYGLDVEAVGVDAVIPYLKVYQDSNRIPMAIAHEVFGPGAQSGEKSDLQQLVDAIAYTQQPHVLPHLRKPTQAFLATANSQVLSYFTQHRITELQLPGAATPTPVQSAVSIARGALSGPVKKRIGRLVRAFR